MNRTSSREDDILIGCCSCLLLVSTAGTTSTGALELASLGSDQGLGVAVRLARGAEDSGRLPLLAGS